MQRPHVSLDNPEVYPFFTERGPNPDFMKRFHGLMAAVFHPETSYMPYTEDTVGSHLAAGKQVFLSLGHVSWFDPSVLAASIHKEEALRPVIGNVVIPGNAPLFNKRLLGRIITEGGAIPTFRRKDVFGKGEEITDAEIEARRKMAGQKVVDICAGNLNNGRNVAMFAEGTRNRGDRAKVQKLQNGISRILEAVERPEDVMLVCMSPYYGRHKAKNIFRPSVGVAHEAVSRTAELTVDDIRECQQASLDLAIERYDQ